MGSVWEVNRVTDLACVATVVSGILRALPTCTGAALLIAPATLAQAFEPAALTTDIPTRPLAQALEAFARQTGLQLVYVSGVLRDRSSRAVSAGLGANEALARILEGTELEFKYLTPRSIRIISAVAVAAGCHRARCGARPEQHPYARPGDSRIRDPGGGYFRWISERRGISR